jgi:hypothetical protein
LLPTTSADGVTVWSVTGSAPRVVATIKFGAPPTRAPLLSPDGQMLVVAVNKPLPRIESGGSRGATELRS